MTPEFERTVTIYKIVVEPEDGADFHFVPQTADTDAVISVGGVKYATGRKIATPLSPGQNIRIRMDCESGDGVAKRTYTIDVACRRRYSVRENPTPDWIFWDDFEDPATTIETGPAGPYYEGFQNHNFEYFKPRPGHGLGGSHGLSFLYTLSKQTGRTASDVKISFGRTNPYPDDYNGIPPGQEGSNADLRSGTPDNLFPDIDFTEVYFRLYMKQSRNWLRSEWNEKFLRVTGFTQNGTGNGGGAQNFSVHLWSTMDPASDRLSIDPATGIAADGETLMPFRYNDYRNWRWLRAKTGPFKIYGDDQNGEWYCIEMHVKLNDPGLSNGLCEFWIDGVWQAGCENLNFIGNRLPGAANKFVGINKFFIENYWNRPESLVQDQWKYIDNLVISTKPIGAVEFIYEGDCDKKALKKSLTAAIGPDYSKPVYQLTADDYLPVAWNGYKKAVERALVVLDNTAALQKEVDAAVKTLENTRTALHARAITPTEKTGKYLFLDDFSSGNLDAYFEKRGIADPAGGYYNTQGFQSTIRRGTLATGATTFQQGMRIPGLGTKTKGGAALAMAFGQITALNLKVSEGLATADPIRRVNIRFYTRSDADWGRKNGDVDSPLSRIQSIATFTDDIRLSINTIIEAKTGKAVVLLPGNKKIFSTDPIFDASHINLWHAIEYAIDLDAGTFEFFVNGLSQGRVENIVWPETPDGMNVLYLDNMVGDWSLYDQKRYFDFLAVSTDGYIGLVDLK